MPAERWGSEVRNAEEVEAAAEHNAGDTVQRRGIPGDLGFVDGEMRGDGTLEALFCEYVLRALLVNVFGSRPPSIDISIVSLGDGAIKGRAGDAVMSCIPPLHHAPRGLDSEAGGCRPSQAELEYSLRRHNAQSATD